MVKENQLIRFSPLKIMKKKSLNWKMSTAENYKVLQLKTITFSIFYFIFFCIFLFFSEKINEILKTQDKLKGKKGSSIYTTIPLHLIYTTLLVLFLRRISSKPGQK